MLMLRLRLRLILMMMTTMMMVERDLKKLLQPSMREAL